MTGWTALAAVPLIVCLLAPARPADTRLDRAVRAAYPNGIELSERGGVRTFDDNRLVETRFGPVLVSRGHIDRAAHTEIGAIAVHYLRERGTRFEVVRAFPWAAGLGSFGNLSDWSVSRRFSDLPVIHAVGGWAGMGVHHAHSVLIELRPSGPVEIARITTYWAQEASGTRPRERLSGTIADIVRGRSFTVRYRGTSRFDERYVRRGSRYGIEGGRKSRLPSWAGQESSSGRRLSDLHAR